MIKWFETVGDHSDIVISSRIRLARNLVNYPFCGRLTPEQEKRLKAEVKNALDNVVIRDILDAIEENEISSKMKKLEFMMLKNNKIGILRRYFSLKAKI